MPPLTTAKERKGREKANGGGLVGVNEDEEGQLAKLFLCAQFTGMNGMEEMNNANKAGWMVVHF